MIRYTEQPVRVVSLTDGDRRLIQHAEKLLMDGPTHGKSVGHTAKSRAKDVHRRPNAGQLLTFSWCVTALKFRLGAFSPDSVLCPQHEAQHRLYVK